MEKLGPIQRLSKLVKEGSLIPGDFLFLYSYNIDEIHSGFITRIREDDSLELNSSNTQSHRPAYFSFKNETYYNESENTLSQTEFGIKYFRALKI